MCWTDPIVKEVREAREKIWKQSGYDFDKLCRRLRRSQKLRGLCVLTAADLRRRRRKAPSTFCN